MLYFSRPFTFFLNLSQWINIFSSLLKHSPWPLWYSLFVDDITSNFTEKREAIRKDVPQKTWHHNNLPMDIGVQILCLSTYYYEWNVLYAKVNPYIHTIDPISSHHSLFSSWLSFFSYHLRIQQQHKKYICVGPKCKDFSVLKAPVFLICHSSRSTTLMWELSTFKKNSPKHSL